MSDAKTLEERIAALEKRVEELEKQINSRSSDETLLKKMKK